MSDYLDTSVVVAALTPEADNRRVQDWLGGQPAAELFFSDWVTTEVSSAFAKKVRMGLLDLQQRADAFAEWQKLREASLSILPVTAAHFETAARFADRHDLGLRAGDALHLAIAASSGHRLVTLDATLARAGPELGVPVLVP